MSNMNKKAERNLYPALSVQDKYSHPSLTRIHPAETMSLLFTFQTGFGAPGHRGAKFPLSASKSCPGSFARILSVCEALKEMCLK